MSRVFRGERYVNMPHHRADITAPSKVVRVHCEGEDYHNADSLTSWLFMKYDMSFKTYRGKSKQRRDELQQEYEQECGRNPNCIPKGRGPISAGKRKGNGTMSAEIGGNPRPFNDRAVHKNDEHGNKSHIMQ